MKKEVIEAIHGSIKKWEGIRDGQLADLAQENCPLCQMFYIDSTWNTEKECTGCPIREKTGYPGCHGVDEYDDVSDELDINHMASSERAKNACQEMINYLKALLPKKYRKAKKSKSEKNAN